MKKIFYVFGISLIGFTVNAQILTSSVPAAGIPQSNAFLDASTAHSSVAGENNNKHKGLVFPDVNLTTFQFENVIADGATLPSYYDGMVVYNTATGNTSTSGINPSVATAVTPGFYYFSNPSGATNANVTGGEWKPLGSSVGAVNNILAVTTATYSAIATDGTLLVDVPTGGATVTLPAAASNNGKILIVKKVDDDTDVLTFSTPIKVTASESFTTLNYATTLKIQSDGTNWWLIN